MLSTPGTPFSPTPTAAPPVTPVDPALVNELHIFIAVLAALLAGVIVVALRRFFIETLRDPMCICNDPESRHHDGDSGCWDCQCRCFIERPAAGS